MELTDDMMCECGAPLVVWSMLARRSPVAAVVRGASLLPRRHTHRALSFLTGATCGDGVWSHSVDVDLGAEFTGGVGVAVAKRTTVLTAPAPVLATVWSRASG